MSNELKTRAGAARAKESVLLNKPQVIAKCLQNLTSFIAYLYDSMKDGEHGVFDLDDLEMIEHVRILLDMETLAMKVKLRGAVQVAALEVY